MSRVRILLLSLIAGALPGCWHGWSGLREPGVCQDGVQYLETDYVGAHHAARAATRVKALAGACTERFPVAGFAPCGAGPHPVVLYVPGTIQPYDHGFISRVLARLARAGYVALSVDYANGRPGQGCERYLPRARCMFDGGSPESAVARACALPQADCSRGLAVLGHSQGGLIALLSADFEPRVRWVNALGVTANPPPDSADLACVEPYIRRLPSERLLAVCGDCDVFFDGTRLNSCDARTQGVTSGLQRLTDLRCGSSSSCLGKAPGSGARWGWIKVPSSRLRDREADHCYMFDQGCFGPPDEAWLDDPSTPWGLQALLDDLRKALPPGQVD